MFYFQAERTVRTRREEGVSLAHTLPRLGHCSLKLSREREVGKEIRKIRHTLHGLIGLLRSVVCPLNEGVNCWKVLSQGQTGSNLIFVN